MSILYYGSDGRVHGLGDKNTLMHYNHNHDKLGRFAKSNGVYSIEKIDKMNYKKFNKVPKEKMPTKVINRTDDFVKDYSTTNFGPDSKNSDIATYMKLQDEIIEKSVDWYESEPKSNRTKAVYKKHSKWLNSQNKYSSKYRKEREKFEDDLAGAVLKDLGYKDTPEARKRIRESGAIIWD